MTIAESAPPAHAAFDRVLLQAAGGEPALLTLHIPSGGTQVMDAAHWYRTELPGDRGLLDRCDGATLDVGCGPGRLTAALAGSGRPALGIDVSPTAVRLTRARGALALHRDVFGPVPGPGIWQALLLADGNIGIGGDPLRLLEHCRSLLAPDGSLHVELAPPGASSWAGSVRIGSDPEAAGESVSESFAWAAVAVDAIAPFAVASGLRMVEIWEDTGRWFASLAR